MMHVTIRRMALVLASVSVGALAALVLYCSVCYCAPVNYAVKACDEQPLNVSIPSGAKLPCNIQGTDLFVQNLASYDGTFYEDGSNREVFDVAAVLIKNCGDTTVSITVFQVDTTTDCYAFEAMMIPPYSSVLVPEKNGKMYTKGDIVSCSGWSLDAQPMPAYPITVTPTDIGTLRITNLSNEPLSDIRVFHKTYLQESDIFVGGIAFETVVSYIAARSFTEIRPAFYAGGYSEILYIA